MIKLFPSILSSNFIFLKKNIKKLENAGINCIHLDIMDGIFVNNITIGPDIVHSIANITKLKLDIHLMLCHPLKYIPKFINSNVYNITFHYENNDNIIEVINLLKTYHNCNICIAINPSTDIKFILKYLKYIDMILIMTVIPGFGNQILKKECLNKIVYLKNFIINNKINCKIQVDGGINNKNLSDVINAGADVIVIGSDIFNNKNIIKYIKNVLKTINY